jgi:hypothetical protein
VKKILIVNGKFWVQNDFFTLVSFFFERFGSTAEQEDFSHV